MDFPRLSSGTNQLSPCKAFQDMVTVVNRTCTGAVYNFISDAHAQNHENDAAAGNLEEGEVRLNYLSQCAAVACTGPDDDGFCSCPFFFLFK